MSRVGLYREGHFSVSTLQFMDRRASEPRPRGRLLYTAQDVDRITLCVFGARWMNGGYVSRGRPADRGRSTGTTARHGGRLADEDGRDDDGAGCRRKRRV